MATPTADWKVVDAAVGVVKEGTYDVTTVEHPEYRKPSDCVKVFASTLAAATGAKKKAA